MYRIALFCMVMIAACTAPTRFISFTARTRPVYTFNPEPEKILLLNNVDIVSKKYRDNKEELFIALINEMMDAGGKRITEKLYAINRQYDPGFIVKSPCQPRDRYPVF
jgi:hypothetical protein